MLEYVEVAAWVFAAWSAMQALVNIAEALAAREKAKLKADQLRDRVFRDACDTIHYLRVENDNLTAMVMAYQKEQR